MQIQGKEKKKRWAGKRRKKKGKLKEGKLTFQDQMETIVNVFCQALQ